MIDEKTMQEYQERVRQAEIDASQSRTQTQQSQQQLMLEEKDKSMIKEQLDLDEEIQRIEFLLKGYVSQRNENGEQVYELSNNPDMIVLSDYGVQLILDTVTWYLNKNTLLSNYDEATINSKMEDFASDLNDDIFMSYEKVFKYPTLEECKDELKRRVQMRINIKKFAGELADKKLNEDEIEAEILKEMEGTIERELATIKAQKMKDKLKRFGMIMRKIQDAVHSTYLRAWKGQERTTLRTHMNISETRGMPQIVQQKGGSPLDFFRRR